jgi:hypothetical protein
MSNKTKEENSVEELQLEAFGTSGAVINAEEFTDELEISSFPKGFFTVSDDPNMVFTANVFTDGNYDQHLVATDVAKELGTDVKLRDLRLAQTASGENIVLSTAAPTSRNSRNSWVRSGQEAIKQGMSSFIRVTRGDDAFRIIKAQRPYPEPKWPELSLEDMIEQAFGERMITDMDHPLVKELLGL